MTGPLPTRSTRKKAGWTGPWATMARQWPDVHLWRLAAVIAGHLRVPFRAFEQSRPSSAQMSVLAETSAELLLPTRMKIWPSSVSIFSTIQTRAAYRLLCALAKSPRLRRRRETCGRVRTRRSTGANSAWCVYCVMRNQLLLRESEMALFAVTRIIVTEDVVRTVLAGAGVGGLDARWSASQLP